jgi:dienelactone hydrolase
MEGDTMRGRPEDFIGNSGAIRTRAVFFAALLACLLALPAFARGAEFKALGEPRELKGAPGIDEWHYEAVVGSSPFDKIGLHRVAKGPNPPAASPVMFYLPGTNMNGEVALDDPRYALPVYLAEHGVDFWALDYRTHFIPPTTEMKDLAELKDWTNEMFASDIEAAASFVKSQTHHDKIFVAGFSRGVEFAYLFAAMNPASVEGLVLYDGFFPPPGRALIPNSTSDYAEDLGGKHLTYDKREKLMQMVIENPDQPAPIPKYKTARENLEHVVYDAGGPFGGHGGLGNPIGGYSDATVLAKVLIAEDRYWPAVQDGGSPFTPKLVDALKESKIPVLAFASTNFNAKWPDMVAAAAHSTGDPDAKVITLKDWGHLDVIAGTKAEHDVFEPTVTFITQHQK